MRHLATALLLLALPAVLAGETTLVVVTGLGGEEQLDQRFHTWAATLMDAAGERYGLRDDQIVYLAGDPDRDPDRARARSTREAVRAELARLAAEMPADATLFLVLIGHGSFRDGVSKINLPGPDMTADDFAAALDAFGDRPIVVANLASASGEFVQALSGARRAIVTATKSGMERNLSLFGQFFVAAFVGDEADVDADDHLSVLEAFNYARQEVERDYEREKKLLTEHAVLDDNGDGQGSRDPTADAAGGEDGRLAATLRLIGTAAGSPDAASDPELAALHGEKARLEEDIAALRLAKDGLDRQEYERRLEALLVELALVHRALRARRGGGDGPP